MLPDFSYELLLWKKGYRRIIGVDEVGRGAFAGPVVAGAVALKEISSQSFVIDLGVNDSKKLSATKRKELVPYIKKYFHWAVGEGSVEEINRFGIVKATEKAMRRAIKNLTIKQYINATMKQFVLIDAFHVKYIAGIGLNRQKAIIKGDEKCLSVSAASIIAKVYRDTLMQKLAKKYRRYQWGKNKGYGTGDHQQAIQKYGVTRLHRTLFVDGYLTTLRKIRSLVR
ncbi:ribonuclease HII [Candidatus Gottesmanbacteria bacterium]|nr:ribonuclease HII [Candidatus Gottesmanbacteria bacterium]